jgi:hypothetical protein
MSDEQLSSFQFPQYNFYMQRVCWFELSNVLGGRPFGGSTIPWRRDRDLTLTTVAAKIQ